MKQDARKLSLVEAERQREQSKRTVNVGEVMLSVAADFREMMVRGGSAIAAALFEDEIEKLCGPKFARGEGLASRWGKQPGEAVLGGRKVKLMHPRVRRKGREVSLESYRQIQEEDPLSERALEQMLIGVSTRRYARSLEPIPTELEERGTSKSSVSRHFVARTEAQLEAELCKPLGDRNWAAAMMDGIQFHEHVILIALGIDETGKKHLLGFREGTTENATVCRELLADLIARGVAPDRSLLFVIDGGKGLCKAINDTFGRYGVVQRCQVHKKRNVREHLPEASRTRIGSVMSQAYSTSDYAKALQQLKNLATSIEKECPSAASSLREGIEETLTLKKLGVTGSLAKTLESTNTIENLNGGIRRVSGRVKRCRHGSMARRWVVTAAIEASRGFRRLRGYKQMPVLMTALRARDTQAETNKTNDNVRQVA